MMYDNGNLVLLYHGALLSLLLIGKILSGNPCSKERFGKKPTSFYLQNDLGITTPLGYTCMVNNVIFEDRSKVNNANFLLLEQKGGGGSRL